MQRALVKVRVDGDGLYPHLPRGAQDPESDLASISDQDAIKHLSVLLEGDVAVLANRLLFVLRAKKL